MNAHTSCSPGERSYAQAVVLKREGNQVELAVTRQNTCSACAQSQQCSSKEESGRTQRVWLTTDIPLKSGETVAVSMPDQEVWQAAVLMYGIPLAGFVIGLMFGALLGEISAMLLAVTGLIAGFVLAGRLARKVPSALQLFQQAPAPLSNPNPNQGGMTHD